MDSTQDPRDIVRGVALREDRPVQDSVQIVREMRGGDDAAFAVDFEDLDGVPRRGLVGLRRDQDDRWHHYGGFLGTSRVTGDRGVWMTWGGWGPAHGEERAVAGGWAADPAAVSARLVDGAGRVMHDDLEGSVFLFMHQGDFALTGARLDLLDPHGEVTRSGPLSRVTR